MSRLSQLPETLFIVNPVSGRGNTLRLWYRIREYLSDKGVQGSEHITSFPGDATVATCKALRNGVRRIVAVGGDGTANEVLNGYFDDEGKPRNREAEIAFVPCGSGNDFHRSLKLRSWREALSPLVESRSELLDVGRATVTCPDGTTCSRFFLNMANIGLGGQVAELVNRWRPNTHGLISGQFSYWFAVILVVGRYRNVPVVVSLDERASFTVQSNIITVANGRFTGGGMKLAPNASLCDGLLDVISTSGIGRFGILKELPRIKSGRHLGNPRIRESRARQVSIDSSEPLAVEIDGELAGVTPVHFEVLPSAVRFVV